MGSIDATTANTFPESIMWILKGCCTEAIRRGKKHIAATMRGIHFFIDTSLFSVVYAYHTGRYLTSRGIQPLRGKEYNEEEKRIRDLEKENRRLRKALEDEQEKVAI